MDLAPYPYKKGDLKTMYFFSGIVFAVAHNLGIEVRWGGDWDSDQDLNDQTWNDLFHWELVGIIRPKYKAIGYERYDISNN